MIRQMFFITLVFVVVFQIAHGKSKCQKQRDHANAMMTFGQFVPECDDNGDYAKEQCNDGAYCYCVDPKTGKQIGKSKRFGRGLNC
ncbi:unnamed protein product [Larinioides sclopetarius]|uniref:Thyroglobulin type-1 domain-containing protein n=1 Tax=Larinioides sclopetarius TaxID=280406 RepID=A0AAV2AP43_9ARAC